MINKIPHSFIYLAGPLLNAAVSFVAMSVFTQFLTTEDFGLFTTFKIYSQIVTILIIFNGFQLLLQKKYTNESGIRQFQSTLFAFSTLVALVLLVTSVVCKNWIAFIIQMPAEWIVPITFYGWLNFCQMHWMHTMQAYRRPWGFIFLQCLSAIGGILVGLVLVIEFHYDWRGRFFGAAFSSVTVIILFLVTTLVKRDIPLTKPSIKHAKEILRFGLPLFPQALGAWVVSSIDRIYLNHFKGLSETGIYGVAFSITAIFIMITNAVNKSFMPTLFETLSERNQTADRRAVKQLLKVDLLYASLAIFGCAVAPLFFSLFIHKSFSPAVTYLYWLLPAYAFFGVTQNRLNLIVFSKKTNAASWSTDSLAAAINFFLCPLMIYKFGALGAAQSTFIAYFVVAFVSWYSSNRALPLPWLSLFKKKQ